MRRRRTLPSARLLHNWSGSTFRFGKMSPADANAAPFTNAPHVGPIDPDFDSFNSLILERQDGRFQRVNLREVA